MQQACWKLVIGSSLLLSAAFLAPGCGESPSGTSGGTGAGGAGGATFGSSGCRTCEKTACANELSACQGEPECAANVECENACAVAASGDVDSACAGACAKPQSGTAKTVFDAFQMCRYSGPGADCAECGRGGSGGTTTSTGTGGAPSCTPPAVLTQTCAASNEPSACNKCQYEKCCDSVEKVFGSGPAVKLKNCYLACPAGDHVCENGCFQKYPDGVPDFAGYQACVFINCAATGVCKVGTACNRCQYKECSCEYAAYYTDPEGFAIDSCIVSCPDNDVACAKDCVTKHPSAAPLFDSLAVCTGQHCVQQCGG